MKESVMRPLRLIPGLALVAFLQSCGPQEAPDAERIGSVAQDVQLSIRNADPTVIRVDSTYISAEVDSAGHIYVRMASSVNGLSSAIRQQVWGNPNGWAEVWAPEL